MDIGAKTEIFDIHLAASKIDYDMVFIGYKKNIPDKNGDFVFINPHKTSEYTCESKDLFIFIGKED